MLNRKEIICILCPLGCRVSIRVDEKGDILEVANFQCKRGERHAINEFRAPVRVLTTTVLVERSRQVLLPVKSSRGIPKGNLSACMIHTARKKVQPPVKAGEVIVRNILGTGADLIATRDLLE